MRLKTQTLFLLDIREVKAQTQFLLDIREVKGSDPGFTGHM
jgi:hypothetical protein